MSDNKGDTSQQSEMWVIDNDVDVGGSVTPIPITAPTGEKPSPPSKNEDE